MGDPTYVRLTDRLATGGSWSDLDSGFAIGGYDVKAFPKGDARAEEAVRAAIRAGILEEASRAEFEEVKMAHAAQIEHPSNQLGHQEGAVRLAAEEQRRRIAARRAGTALDGGERDDGYDTMTVAELKAEIENRDGVSLPPKVNKTNLIAVLRADDADDEDKEDEPPT